MVEVVSSRRHSALRKNFGGQQGNYSRAPKSYHCCLCLCGDDVKHDDHLWRATAALSALQSQGKVSPVVYCQNNVGSCPRSLRGSLGWWVRWVRGWMLNHPHGMPLTIWSGHRLSMWGGGTQSSTLMENEHGGRSGLGTSAEWCMAGSVERCQEASYKYIRWSVMFLRKKKK